MAGWLHGVFVGAWLFVFPLCGFSLSLFCNYHRKQCSPNKRFGFWVLLVLSCLLRATHATEIVLCLWGNLLRATDPQALRSGMRGW